MQLSDRLNAIAAMVPSGAVLADIGTDHGYLPIELYRAGRIPSAIAMDINAGPLKRAQEHIAACGLEDYIGTRRSDGLTALKEGEADCVVIAGMGGRLTVRILELGAEVLKGITTLVLQPQSEIDKVRRYLAANGFRIADEDMVFEDGKFYPLMQAVRGTMELRNSMEEKYGPVLLRKAHPVLRQYLLKEKAAFEKIKARLSLAGGGRSQARLGEIEQELACLDGALALFD